MDVNPMTAVAEGASIFAESINWESENHNRKSCTGETKSEENIGLSFKYLDRTSEKVAKVVVQMKENLKGYTFEFKCLNTGWVSGCTELAPGVIINLPLNVEQNNQFEVSVWDEMNNKISLSDNKINITKTAATIGSIPASHTVAVEILEKIGGRASLFYIVKEGEPLPKKNTIHFKAAQSIRAGSSSSLNFKFWEGSIEDPITDNRPIGCFSVRGTDFETGVIPVGAELICEFEMSDSGHLSLELLIPEIEGVFIASGNLYSRQGDEMDFSTDIDRIIDEANSTLIRIEAMADRVDDPMLVKAREKIDAVLEAEYNESETEDTQQAYENIIEVKKLLAQVKKNNLPEVQQGDLDLCIDFFNSAVKQFAKPNDITSFENLAKTAQKSIIRGSNEFENQLDEMKYKNFEILYRQDWFIISHFNSLIENPRNYSDSTEFNKLKKEGQRCLENDDIDSLRLIAQQLNNIKIRQSDSEDMSAAANILRG